MRSPITNVRLGWQHKDKPTIVHECARTSRRTNVGTDWDAVTFCGLPFYWTGKRYTGAARAVTQREMGDECDGPTECLWCIGRTVSLSGLI